MERATGSPVKIGLFGGTFNPVHLGHLRSAEEIRERFDLDTLFFIPSYIPPHKKMPVAPAAHRAEMVRLSIENNPRFALSDIELQRSGSSYSCETIDHFNQAYNHRAVLYFIIGIDAFRDIHTWKRYPDFLSVCNLIVMKRPGGVQEEGMSSVLDTSFSFSSSRGCYTHESGSTLHVCDVTLLDISSTDLRERLKRNASVQYLISESVRRYIDRHRLYR